MNLVPRSFANFTSLFIFERDASSRHHTHFLSFTGPVSAKLNFIVESNIPAGMSYSENCLCGYNSQTYNLDNSEMSVAAAVNAPASPPHQAHEKKKIKKKRHEKRSSRSDRSSFREADADAESDARFVFEI